MERAVLAQERSAAAVTADDVRRREKELERASKRGLRDALLEARAEVEKAVALAREGKEREARRALEERIAALAEGTGDGGQGTGEAGPGTGAGEPAEVLSPVPYPLSPGLKVRIRSLGVEGEIESVRGDDVAVRVRGRRVRVRASDLAAAPSPRPPVPPFPAPR